MVEMSNMIVLKGSVIRLETDVIDFDGVTPLVPDTIEVKIYDAAKTLQDTITTGFGTYEDGRYYLDYLVEGSVMGEWKAVWTVVKDDKPDVDYIIFTVREVLE